MCLLKVDSNVSEDMLRPSSGLKLVGSEYVTSTLDYTLLTPQMEEI
jgi:hypothetical protein